MFEGVGCRVKGVPLLLVRDILPVEYILLMLHGRPRRRPARRLEAETT